MEMDKILHHVFVYIFQFFLKVCLLKKIWEAFSRVPVIEVIGCFSLLRLCAFSKSLLRGERRNTSASARWEIRIFMAYIK